MKTVKPSVSDKQTESSGTRYDVDFWENDIENSVNTQNDATDVMTMKRAILSHLKAKTAIFLSSRHCAVKDLKWDQRVEACKNALSSITSCEIGINFVTISCVKIYRLEGDRKWNICVVQTERYRQWEHDTWAHKWTALRAPHLIFSVRAMFCHRSAGWLDLQCAVHDAKIFVCSWTLSEYKQTLLFTKCTRKNWCKSDTKRLCK